MKYCLCLLVFSLFVSKHSSSQGSEPQYIIPVVVHVLHQHGDENISDLQVLDAIGRLNLDFRAANPDTSQVVAQYKSLIADMGIEFRLATKDPRGNCTNGIEHIYTHLTNDADDYSKINQWDRNRYLNIWVVDGLATAGVAGTVYKPSETEGVYCFRDGILIFNYYFGSIGTSSLGTSRFLDMCMGTYFGMNKTYGDAELGFCGDDGIADTPPTKPLYACDLTNDECEPGYAGLVQNFMANSYCMRMFTHDQKTFVHDALNATTEADRKNLWSAENLALTGVDGTAVSNCAPVADFYANSPTKCQGSPVNFYGKAWQASTITYEWHFPGGTPSTSADQNPIVTYAEAGFKDVTLIAHSDGGSDTLTRTQFLYISPTDWVDHVGPFAQDFEGALYYWSRSLTPGMPTFARATDAGNQGSIGMQLILKTNQTEPVHCFAMPLQEQRGASQYELFTESYDLASTTDMTISFDYACAAINDSFMGKLELLSSDDCGATWQYRKTLENDELRTADHHPYDVFVPEASEWKTTSIALGGSQPHPRMRFKFRYTATDASNAVYIDNFNIVGILSTPDAAWMGEIEVAPNPVSAGSAIHITVPADSKDLQVRLADLNGNALVEKLVPSQTQQMDLTMSVPAGCYFVEMTNGQAKRVVKVVVM